MANGHGGVRKNAGRKKLTPEERQSRREARRELKALRDALDGVVEKPKSLPQDNLPMELPSQRRRSGWEVSAPEIVRQSRAYARALYRSPEQNPFRMPAFPPRAIPKDPKVRMALDESIQWAATEWSNVGAVFNAVGAEGLQFLGYPFLAELAQRPEYRVISETRADDATRKWIDFDVVGGEKEREEEKEQDAEAQMISEAGLRPDPDEERQQREDRVKKSGKMEKIKAIKDEMKRLELRDKMYAVCRDDGLFGRSHIFIDNGQSIELGSDDLALPIGNGRNDVSKEAIARGALKNITNVEPVWAYPMVYNAINPLREDFYNPTDWYVMGTKVHVSRLMRFVGSPVPDLLKAAYAFGGLSMSQLAKPYVDIWLKTRQSVGQLIHSFSVMVLMTDLATLVQPGTSGGAGELLARVAAFNALRDNAGTFVVNKNTEDFKNVSASLSGLHELQAQAQEHMMSVARIPDVKFTGINPTGLNASSEGVLQAYYDTIAAYQNRFLRPNLTKIIDFIQLSLFGEVDPEITFEFEPLWELNEKERAELQKTEAERDQTYVDMGAISNEEVRKRIIDDPHLPYADLDPEDVPELRQEESEGLVPQGAGHGLEAVLGGNPQQEAGGAAGAEKPANENDQPGPFEQAADVDPLFAFDAFDPAKHPRGQPENAGEFAKGGGGGKSPAQKSFWAGEHAPPPAPKPLDPKKLKRVGPQLGSNPGGIFEDKEGRKFYVKAGHTKDHVRNELTAAALYALAGAPTLRYRDVAGGGHVATEMEKLDKDNARKLSPEEVARAREDFITHAWLANYDAVGTGGDNLVTIRGVPTAVDLGGALDYRARGAPKGSSFGDEVTEIDSMRDPHIAPDASKIFGGMTPAELQKSALNVTSIPDDEIRDVVHELGGKPELADKLIARKRNIAERAKTFGEEGDPTKPKSTVVFAKGKDLPVQALNGIKFEKWALPSGVDWNDVDGQAELSEDSMPEQVKVGKHGFTKRLSSGLIIREPDGRVWLTRPKGGYGGYANTFPKGQVEPGLSMQANAIKEAWEETGIKGRVVGLLGDAEGDTSVTRYYLAERQGGDPADAGEEADAAVLAPPDRLNGLLNRGRDREIAEYLHAPKEMARDAAPRTLYVNRPLLNGDDVVRWARDNGIAKTLAPEDMHVTIAFSREPLDWGAVPDGFDTETVPEAAPDRPRSVERLGDEGAVVLRFESGDLAKRWRQFRDAGASWDHPGYKPHVTVTMDAGDVDLGSIEPYAGPLEFGPEEFQEIGTRGDDWVDKARASMIATDAWEEGKHPRGGSKNRGQFSSGGGGGGAQKPVPAQQKQGAAQQKPAPVDPEEARRQKSRDAQKIFGRHIADQLAMASPKDRAKYEKHVAATREFFSAEGVRRAVAKAVSGVANAMLESAHEASLLPVVHHVAERAVELAGMSAIPGSTLTATAVAAYAAHHLLEAAGLTKMSEVKKLLRSALKGAASVITGTQDVARQVERFQQRRMSGPMAFDASDGVAKALIELIAALESGYQAPDDDEDGGQRRPLAHDEFEESQHPRVPAGQHGGGEFAKGGGGGGGSETEKEKDLGLKGGEGSAPEKPKGEASKKVKDAAEQLIDAINSHTILGKHATLMWPGEYGGEKFSVNPDGSAFVAIKDVGEWKNPPGKEHEEDYDWKEMTASTGSELSKIIDDVEKSTGLKVKVATGEKNMTYFTLSEPKAKEEEEVPQYLKPLYVDFDNTKPKKTKFGGLWKTQRGLTPNGEVQLNAKAVLGKPAFAGQSYRSMLAYLIKSGPGADLSAEDVTALKTKLVAALYAASAKATALGKEAEVKKIGEALGKIAGKEPGTLDAGMKAWELQKSGQPAPKLTPLAVAGYNAPEPKPAPQSIPKGTEYEKYLGAFKADVAKIKEDLGTGVPSNSGLQKAKLAAQHGVSLTSLIDSLTLPENQQLKSWYGSIANALTAQVKVVAQEAEKAKQQPAAAAPAAKMSPAGATEAELAKAKKTVALQLQYVPNAPSTPAAQKLVDAFNAKWADKAVPDDATAMTKIADFNALKESMVPLMSAAQKEAAENAKVAAEKAKKAQADQEANFKAAAAKHEAEIASYKKDLGISDAEAQGFDGLLSMLGKNKASVVQEFKSSDVQAGHGVSKFEGALIRAYKKDSSIVNEEMRKPEASWTTPQVMFAKVLNKALGKLPGVTMTTIRNTDLGENIQKRYTPGMIVFEHGFTGTSKVKPNGVFHGNTRFFVTGIGKRGADISSMHGFEGEQEVLYQAHTMFHIDKVEGQVGGSGEASYKVWMTEVEM